MLTFKREVKHSPWKRAFLQSREQVPSHKACKECISCKATLQRCSRDIWAASRCAAVFTWRWRCELLAQMLEAAQPC